MLIKPKPRLLGVWEQGGHLGHLSNLRLPIEVALEAGFEVVLAARELHRVGEVLGGLPITLLQAPFKQNVASADQAAFLSYTHLLGQQCFSSSTELEMYVRAWRGIFDLVRPHIVLFEHSPTALVAAHAYTFRKVLVGGGFAVPDPQSLMKSPFLPFPTTTLTPAVAVSLPSADARLLALINVALRAMGLPVIGALGEIFGQAQAHFLATWPALDHFGARENTRYLGVAPLSGGTAPEWPSGDGQKVFAYLQFFPAIEQFLNDLQMAQVCALLLVRDLPPILRQRFSNDRMRFIDDIVDLQQVAAQADWVVHHGNHSTMASFMLGGLPQLVVPRHQEHLFSALRLVSQGAAAMAFQDQSSFATAIRTMLTNEQLKQCALQIASRCVPFDRAAVRAHVGQTYTDLLA